MTDRYPRETARIYSLADRVRFGAIRPAKPAAPEKASTEPAIMPGFGGGWYHDAAIRESDPARKG